MAARANPSMVTLGNEEDLRLGTMSITSLTRSSNTATATCAGHGLSTGDIVTIAGATYSTDIKLATRPEKSGRPVVSRNEI